MSTTARRHTTRVACRMTCVCVASGILAAITLMSAVAGTETYEYDALGRLKSTSQTDGTTVEYDLDAAGNRETVTTTIVPGSVQFSAATYSVGEAGASITITVTRVSGNVGAISVAYGTSNGTASAGSDYTATSGTLNWSTGDTTSKTFLVSITNDAVYEPNETFTVSLSNPTNGASLGSPSAATVTITNDDPVPPSGSLQLTASSYSIAESAGSITISLSRTGGSYGNVGVSYATGTTGTATFGSDYTATSGALSWAHGETVNKTFPVTIVNDATFEADETFSVFLSSPTGGATLGAPSSAWVTITNDDSSAPSIPANCRKSPTGNQANYSILWDASSGSVTHYVLMEALSSGWSGPTYTINAPSTLKNFSNKPSGEYWYRVKACNSATGACSAYSNQVFKLVCNGPCQ